MVLFPGMALFPGGMTEEDLCALNHFPNLLLGIELNGTCPMHFQGTESEQVQSFGVKAGSVARRLEGEMNGIHEESFCWGRTSFFWKNSGL
jgi:hypothetical protein